MEIQIRPTVFIWRLQTALPGDEWREAYHRILIEGLRERCPVLQELMITAEEFECVSRSVVS
jgi:hypothetical protein